MTSPHQVMVSLADPLADFIVLDKPAGWSMHNEKPSLQEAMIGNGLGKLHFINRLDRETSGLVLATPHPDRVESLKKAMHGDTATKIYRGVTRNPREGSKEGLWNEALSDKAEGRREPLGKSADRIPAQTGWSVHRESQWLWDVEFQLLTGRQHQIRKHCAFHSLPLAGDTRYGREAFNRKIRDTYQVSRLMLHAWKLRFPWKGEVKDFEAPLPPEFSILF